MDYITRKASACRELAIQGLRFGRLTCINRNGYRWQIQCFMAKDLLTRDRAKGLVAWFLAQEWEGYCASFSIKPGSADGEFYCTFYSEVL